MSEMLTRSLRRSPPHREESLAEDTFGSLDDETVGSKGLEDHVEIFEVLLEVFRCHQDIVDIDKDSRDVPQNLVVAIPYATSRDC